MITHKRKWPIGLIINMVLFVGILTAIYLALNASWVHRIYFSIIEDRLGWQISAQDISIQPWFGSVKIRQLNIQSPNKNQLYAADRVDIQVNPISVVRGKLIVHRLELDGIYLAFQKSLDEKPPPEEPRFTIERVRKIANVIGNSIFLQNISVTEGRVRPVQIIVSKGGQVKTHIEIGEFNFDLDQSLLRENLFNFSAKDFSINDKIVASFASIQSHLSATQVSFHPLQMMRPEGNYTLNLDASLQEKSVTGGALIEADLPKIFQHPVKASGTLRLIPPYLHFDSFEFLIEKTELMAGGRWHLVNGDHKFTANAKEVDVARLAKNFVLEALHPLGGKASLTAEMQGRFPKVSATGKLHGSPAQYGPAIFANLQSDLTLAWPRLAWHATAEVPEAKSIVIDGEAEFAQRGETVRLLSLSSDFESVPLKALLPDLDFLGHLSGHVEGSQEPEGLKAQGTLSVIDGAYKLVELDMAQLRFDLAKKRLQVPELSFQPKGGNPVRVVSPINVVFGDERITFKGDPLKGLSLEAHYNKASKIWMLDSYQYESAGNLLAGRGLYRPDKTFQASAKGSVDASVLALFRSIFNRAEGRLNVDLKASGSVEKPVLTGKLAFHRANLELRGLGDDIRDFNGQMIIDRNRLTLQDFQGLHGDGQFMASGTMQLDRFRPTAFNLKFLGRALTFRLRGAMQVDFDADLTLTGKMPSPLVAGKVDLLSGRYYKDFRITQAVFKEQVLEEKKAPTSYFDEWRWDIQVRNSGELRLRNNIADVYLLGDLALTGTTKRPVLTGVVNTGAGELHYLGHDMKIVEGLLEFRDPLRVNPIVTLEAHEEISATESRGLRSYYTIIVRLEGPLDNLEIKLSSSPPLDRADIVSLLAFGMTQSELRESGAQRSAFASNILAESLGGGLGATFGEKLGLDVLRFEAAADSDDAISGVAVGKELSDRLTIEFYTDISPEAAQRRIRSKYFLTDNFFLEGTNTFEEDANRFELNVSIQFQKR